MSKTSHLLSKQNSQQPKQFRGGEKKVMKKSLSLLVAIAMVFSMFATLVSADETKTAGEKLQEFGIIKGTSEGLEEGAEWKRQDVTILLSRLLNVEEKAKTAENTHGFADVTDKTYSSYISWAKAEGYFTGKTATEFGINQSITNQEFAAVLLRVLGFKELPYAEAFEKAVEAKLVPADLVATDNAVRGGIYTALVTALDFEIEGKKLGTILGLKGYEITDVKVVGAQATNSKTVKVEFNQEIGEVVANNFVVKNKETDSVEVISTVAVSDKVATLTLFDSLAKDKTYVVEVSAVTSKDGKAAQVKAETVEFTYVKTAPASVSIPVTTVAYDDVVGIVIKDANGNDITADIDMTDSEVVKLSTSATNVVYIDTTTNELVARDDSVMGTDVGYSVVNVDFVVDEDTTISTGNIVVTVQESVAVVTGIDEVTFGTVGEDAVTSIEVESSDTLSVTVKNADGSRNTDAETNATFKSANPTVVVVDQTTGLVSAVKVGSATVNVSTTFNGKTVSKSVVITVKDKAKFTSIELDKSSAKLVYDLTTPINETVKVTLLDQYGEKFAPALADAVEISAKGSKDGLLEGTFNGATADFDKVAVSEANFTSNSFEIEIGAVTGLTKNDSQTIAVQVGKFKKNISVSLVKASALAGYIVEVDNAKIDKNTDSKAVDPNALDEKDATVAVYAKDTNGNKIAVLNNSEFSLDAAEEFVTINNEVMTTKKVGTEKVTVLVNNVKVGTVSITVVDTTKTLTKVVQAKNAITVGHGVNVITELFGSDENGAAFVGYDQYGKKITFVPGNYTVYSNDTTLVDNGVSHASNDGTVLLTAVVKGTAYTITVKVQ